MNDLQKLPYYMFMITGTDGNVAYLKIHQGYPLQFDINELLKIGSKLHSFNQMQRIIVHPDIQSARKEQIDLSKSASIRSISASTYQIRFMDTVSGHLFILACSNSIDYKKIDNKLEELYKIYVNYILKAPFFNPTQKIENQAFIKKTNDVLYM